MKKRIFILFFIMLFCFTVVAEGVEEDIAAELELEKAKGLLPDSLDSVDIDFSPSNTPSENGLNVSTFFKTVFSYFFDVLGNEILFVFSSVGILMMAVIIFSFIDASKTTMNAVARFAVSGIVSALLISHIESAFERVIAYINEISVFMTGLMPFLGSISLVNGEFSTSVVQSAFLLTSVSALQTVVSSAVIPLCKAVCALSVAGYISGRAFGALSSFISSIATKVISVSCGIMCLILYFQNSVSAITDSLALRSVKLAAGSFVPVVGSFVSEASGTLIAGAKLVKSSFGVFAVAALIYMSVRPIINFLTVKLSVRFSGIVAKLLGCEKEAGIFSEIAGVYNVLSAIMIVSACFFVFFIAVFIKSEVA